MSDLNKYFDKIFCINLDRRPDRWESVKKEFEKWGITSVERYSAIDGNTIENNTNILNGELGILETHYNLIKKCKDENLDTILVMEDDVYFTEKIKQIDEYMDSVPKDWDLLYFGGTHVYGPPPVAINDKVVKITHTVAIHCVAIKKNIFEPLLLTAKKRQKQIDVCYAQLQKSFDSYCFHPNIALQTTGFSDIQNKVVDYNYLIKK